MLQLQAESLGLDHRTFPEDFSRSDGGDIEFKLANLTSSSSGFARACVSMGAESSNEDARDIRFGISRARIPIRPSRSPEFLFSPAATPGQFSANAGRC